MASLETTHLYKWLRKQNEQLATRVVTVRNEMAKWLPYILQFFPHYPSHGVDHSDRIISQLSKVLFNGSKPVVPFSASEAYCLLCAVYLHDMGMVVSSEEATDIINTDRWKSFISKEGKGYEGYQQYQKLLSHPNKETDIHGFLTNLVFRQLIADFARHYHHERCKVTLEMHPFIKQLVDDGDSVAFETIADLCVAHGLSESDLSDDHRFPEQRDVLGDKVNVRFLARLLRIGDLLDMDSKRADPMSAHAAAPLPSNSLPHWKQYSAKKHENITPAEIAFRFECKEQEAHRVLRDWFGWLENEVRITALEQDARQTP